MKRLLLGVAILGASWVLAGCPVYPDNPTYPGCDECCSSTDCGPGYACTLQGQCVPWEADASTSVTDCGSCPTGTTCTLVGGQLQCLSPNGPTQSDASTTVWSDSGPELTNDGGDAATSPADVATPVIDAAVEASPSDASAPVEGGPIGGLCNSDAPCGGNGAKCIDGQCVAQGKLCSDGTQCLVAGDSCVDGRCLPLCGGNASTACPAGYACDFNRGVCSVNPSACSTSSDCQGGAVCVESRCVAPCASVDAGAECPATQVCVNGGCIPDEQAQFTCQNDGSSGIAANSCPPSSTCLHGDCYPACGGDSGGCGDGGDVCKSVRIAKGTYAVCAGPSSLGSECDPAVGDYCANSGVCVDGYCK